jgi:hypothetical protein
MSRPTIKKLFEPFCGVSSPKEKAVGYRPSKRVVRLISPNYRVHYESQLHGLLIEHVPLGRIAQQDTCHVESVILTVSCSADASPLTGKFFSINYNMEQSY